MDSYDSIDEKHNRTPVQFFLVLTKMIEQGCKSGATVATERCQRSAVALLVAVQAGLLAYSAIHYAPTRLEPAFLASGISHWQSGRFELYRVNPPLVRMIAALPVMIIGCKTDWRDFSDAPGARAEFGIDRAFIAANGVDIVQQICYARLACIPFSLIGAFFAWRWASELYGANAGLLTLTLYVFEPNLLAHGSLITPDAACTAFGIVAGYSYWRWLGRPTLARAILAGCSLGFAQLAKMSWLILMVLWPVLFLCWCCCSKYLQPSIHAGVQTGVTANDQRTELHVAGFRQRLFQLCAIMLIAIYTMNLFYAFDGTGTSLKEFQFVSRTLSGQDSAGTPENRFRHSWIGGIPIPLPKQYVLGFDSQKKDFEDYGHRSYLRGHWQENGWWYYYIYGLLVKVPSGTLILFGLAVVLRFTSCSRHVALRDELALLLPAVALMLLVSSQTEFSIHLRYVFPALGLALVFLGQLANVGVAWYSPSRVLVVALTLWSVTSAVWTFPHHLSYFNEFAGGSENGRCHLMGSSLDWGQGTFEVIDWIVESGWEGPVIWSTHHATLAADLLEKRRSSSVGRRANWFFRTMRVYGAEEFDSPERSVTSEVVVHRFPFGVVIVWSQE